MEEGGGSDGVIYRKEMAGTVVGDWVTAADGIDLVGRKEMDGLGRVNSASGKLWFEIASSIHSPAWRPLQLAGDQAGPYARPSVCHRVSSLTGVAQEVNAASLARQAMHQPPSRSHSLSSGSCGPPRIVSAPIFIHTDSLDFRNLLEFFP